MHEKLVHDVHLCHYDRSQEGGMIQLGREEGRRERKKGKGRRGRWRKREEKGKKGEVGERGGWREVGGYYIYQL